MDPNRWRQIDDLFHSVRDGTVAEREAVLTRIGDGGLRAEVESLLAAHDQPSSFIDAAAFEVPPLAGDDVSLDSPSGSTIGHYRIGELIGTGAMGAVYAAQQESPSRTVALKILRCAPGRDDLAARLFQREGQALARLQHPAIATIYEAGRSDDGWHYFAMERVFGIPLTQYVREHGLPLRDRLDLFCVICDAVHYAHQRGVIHRDLKPSNILVEENGQPKVLDFGLARITDPDTDVTDATQAGAFHGTIAYASPEQVNGKAHDIDARSDVYSLGVILFELLTDLLPIDVRGQTLADASRLICEQRPSPVGSIRKELRGDLETIVLKALEKEPSRRYSSAAALGDDIKRYLRDEPVEAMPDSGLYLLRKAIWRHRRVAAASATFVVFLLVAITAIFVEWRTAEAARIHAEDAERTQTELRVAADNARIDAKHQAEEARHAETAARRLQRQAQEITDCVMVLMQVRGDLARAVPRFRDSLAHMRRVHSDEPLHVAKFIHNLARLLWTIGEYAESAQLYREALTIRRENGGEELGRTLNDYGMVLLDSGDYTEAEKAFREAIEEGLNQPRDTRFPPYVGLGRTLVRQKKYDEAEKWLLQAWDIMSDGPPRPSHDRPTVEALIELYDARAAIDPTSDNAAKAAEWRLELEALPKPGEKP